MLEELEKKYDEATAQPEYIGVTSSLAMGFLPAIIWGKQAHFLGASIAFQVGASVVSNYLKEHGYITQFQHELIDYTTSAGIFLTSYNSYNDLISKAQPLKGLPLGNMIYSLGAENVAKAYSFGGASLPNMIAASEIGKAILRNVDDENAYPAAPAHLGVWLGAKYFASMLVKYSLFPIIPEGASKLLYSGHYLGAGAVQGAILVSMQQTVDPLHFDGRNFTKAVIESGIENAISAFLYSVPGDIAFGSDAFTSIREHKVIGYAPISIAVEDGVLALKHYFIPQAADYTIDNSIYLINKVLSSNSTMIDEL
jgi:hypothetical protein